MRYSNNDCIEHLQQVAYHQWVVA